MFTQTDPAPLGAGSAFESSYVYGLNSPLVYTDPSGLRASAGTGRSGANPIASANPCAGKVPPAGNYPVAFNGACFPIPNGFNAVTNSKGELGYVPSKYCNDGPSKCVVTGGEVLRDSSVGKVISGVPVFLDRVRSSEIVDCFSQLACGLATGTTIVLAGGVTGLVCVVTVGFGCVVAGAVGGASIAAVKHATYYRTSDGLICASVVGAASGGAGAPVEKFAAKQVVKAVVGRGAKELCG